MSTLHPPSRTRILSILGLGALLSFGSGWYIRHATDSLVVGFHTVPHPTGAIACAWTDGSGITHTLPPQVTASGRVSFHIPSHASLFRFTFSPTDTPYQIQALTFWHLPLFSAQWLNNMVNPEHSVYTQQYMGSRDTLAIAAQHGCDLLYSRFFRLLLRITTHVHSLAPPACALLGLLFGGLIVVHSLRKHEETSRFLFFLSHLERYTHTAPIPILLAATLAAVCLTLPPPVFTTHPGCDPSWSWLLNYYALNPLAVGSSIFFTYGPLGFTLMPQAIGNNVAIGLICTAGYAFCYMFTFFAFVRYCPCSKQGLWCLLLCMVFLPANEWRWSVLILFILLLCAHIPCNTRYLLVCLSFLLGVIIVYSSLLKFTLAITSVLCVTITVLHIAVFSKKKLLIFLPVLVVTLALGFLFASLTLFSTPSDLLKWMNVSWEIASGYNTAMVTQVSMIEIQLPLFLMASYLFAVVPARKTNRERIALIALVSPLVFFSLKYSITRAGIGNCRAIAYVFPFVTAMLITCADLQWRPRLIRLFAFQFVVSVALFVISGIAYQTPVCGFSFKNFFSTLNIRKSYQTAKAESEQALLPLRLPHDWRIAIGTNTFSSFPTELTYVPANGLNFVSFPIIQGYSAYTRKLDRLGARLYESENAPTWVLCEFAKTDQRNGMIDTPAVWNAIMTRYQFADSMNNLCLMEKKKTSIPSKIKPVQTIVIKQGARLNISKDNEHTLYMSVHWPQSLIGKIISLVFRNTFCSINLERENGQSQRWRLTPDTAQTPFSLDDIPFDDNDFRMILSGTAQSMLRIKSVLFACDWPSFYSETITVTIYRAEHHSANSICLGSECVVKSHKTHPCLGSP